MIITAKVFTKINTSIMYESPHEYSVRTYFLVCEAGQFSSFQTGKPFAINSPLKRLKKSTLVIKFSLNTNRRYKCVLRDSAHQSKTPMRRFHDTLVGNQWAYFFTSILKWNLALLFFNASLFRNTLGSVFVLELS